MQDDWAWLPDDEDMFVPAKVIKSGFKAGEPGKVKTEDGEVLPRADSKISRTTC